MPKVVIPIRVGGVRLCSPSCALFCVALAIRSSVSGQLATALLKERCASERRWASGRVHLSDAVSAMGEMFSERFKDLSILQELRLRELDLQAQNAEQFSERLLRTIHESDALLQEHVSKTRDMEKALVCSDPKWRDWYNRWADVERFASEYVANQTLIKAEQRERYNELSVAIAEKQAEIRAAQEEESAGGESCVVTRDRHSILAPSSVEDLQREAASLTEERAEAEKEMRALDGRLDALSSELSTARETLDRMRLRRVALAASIVEMRETCAHLERRKSSLTSKSSAVSHDWAEWRNIHKNAMDSLTRSNGVLNSLYEAIRAEERRAEEKARAVAEAECLVALAERDAAEWSSLREQEQSLRRHRLILLQEEERLRHEAEAAPQPPAQAASGPNQGDDGHAAGLVASDQRAGQQEAGELFGNSNFDPILSDLKERLGYARAERAHVEETLAELRRTATDGEHEQAEAERLFLATDRQVNNQMMRLNEWNRTIDEIQMELADKLGGLLEAEEEQLRVDRELDDMRQCMTAIERSADEHLAEQRNASQRAGTLDFRHEQLLKRLAFASQHLTSMPYGSSVEEQRQSFPSNAYEKHRVSFRASVPDSEQSSSFIMVGEGIVSCSVQMSDHVRGLYEDAAVLEEAQREIKAQIDEPIENVYSAHLAEMEREREDIELCIREELAKSPPDLLKEQMAREADAVLRLDFVSGLLERQRKIESDAKMLASLHMDISQPRFTVIDKEAGERLFTEHFTSDGDYRRVVTAIKELTSTEHIRPK